MCQFRSFAVVVFVRDPADVNINARDAMEPSFGSREVRSRRLLLLLRSIVFN